MQQVPSVISKKEQVLFDLLCCVNELHHMRNELSPQDFAEITQKMEMLRASFYEKPFQPNLMYQRTI